MRQTGKLRFSNGFRRKDKCGKFVCYNFKLKVTSARLTLKKRYCLMLRYYLQPSNRRSVKDNVE